MGFTEEKLKGHMEVKDITQRLFEQSDAELHEEIDAAFKPAHKLITDGCSGYVEVCGSKVDRHIALNALREKAFEMHRDKRRDKKVADFMDKVARLGEEIDELRNTLNR